MVAAGSSQADSVHSPASHVNARQQAPLDLGAQLEGSGPLTPLEQVRMAPVGDDHEGEDVRRSPHDPHRLVVRFGVEEDLE